MDSFRDVGSGLVDKHRRFFHPEFVFLSVGDPAEFPHAGRAVGPDAFKAWLREFEKQYTLDKNSWKIRFYMFGNRVIAHTTCDYLVNGQRLEDLDSFLIF
jgi:hypothetical protein